MAAVTSSMAQIRVARRFNKQHETKAVVDQLRNKFNAMKALFGQIRADEATTGHLEKARQQYVQPRMHCRHHLCLSPMFNVAYNTPFPLAMDVAATGAPRLQRALTKVRAESGMDDIAEMIAGENEVFSLGDDASGENEVFSLGDDASDENQSEQIAARCASSGNEKNPIRLLDVASLSVEGSQGHANEDRCVVASNERFHLFAVVDGHGGSWAGDYLVEELFKTLDEVYDDGFDHAKLAEAMEELDRKFCAMAMRKTDMSGACLLAVLLYIDPNTDTAQKIVLNIGDCRAIIQESPEPSKKAKGKAPSSTGKTLALSDDHCAANVKERMRALNSGAYIQNKRIAGVLEPFRTIGDIDLKGPNMKNWVIATPEIRQSELLIGRSILVIATDGVWTVLNNNRTMAHAVKELGARQSAESAAHAIVKEAREFGSCDDVTVIVVSV
ncbi:hypothetical protein PInf_019315 [Phytophthora infestans]|nr:hypothetical protein PInf_019315 [Phytophthora infestans]